MRSITSQRQLDRTLSQIDGNLDWERDMAAEAATLYMEHCFRRMAQRFPRHRFGCNFVLGMNAIHMVPAFRGYTDVRVAIGLMFRRAHWPGINQLHGLVIDLEKIAWSINSRYGRQLVIAPIGLDNPKGLPTLGMDSDQHRKLVADAFCRAREEDKARRERIRMARTCNLSG